MAGGNPGSPGENRLWPVGDERRRVPLAAKATLPLEADDAVQLLDARGRRLARSRPVAKAPWTPAGRPGKVPGSGPECPREAATEPDLVVALVSPSCSGRWSAPLSPLSCVPRPGPGLSDDAGADQISTTRDQIGTLQAAVVAGATRIRQLTVAALSASDRAGRHPFPASPRRPGAIRPFCKPGWPVRKRRCGMLGESLVTAAAIGAARAPGSLARRRRDSTGPVGTGLAYAGLAASVSPGRGRSIPEVARSNAVAAGTTLAAQQRAVGQAAAARGSLQARLAALDEAVTEQAQVNSLEGRLVRLVEAAQAAQAQAARAQAARAVQAAGAARATEAAATGSQPRRPVVATQGLPVNNGIVAVVQAVVGAGPARAPEASAGGSVSPRPAGSNGRDRPAPVVTRTVAPPPGAAPTTTPDHRSSDAHHHPTGPDPPTSTLATATATATATTRPRPALPAWTGEHERRLAPAAPGVSPRNNYCENTGNDCYGAYQFSQQTWTDLGVPAAPTWSR